MSGSTSVSVTVGAEVELDFEEMLRTEYLKLLGAMFLMTGDRSEAEDLVQEAFSRVYERWAKVRSMDSPPGYVYRTALNLYRKRLRRGARRGNLNGAPAVAEGDPAATAERRAAIRDALMAVSPEQREALVLVEWLGLDAKEAGAVLGISAESVRARVHRARLVLSENGSEGSMGDVRTLLEEAVGNLRLSGDELQRVVGRAERRERRQRVVAAVMALIIAAAGLSGAVVAFGHRSHPADGSSAHRNGMIALVSFDLHHPGNLALYVVDPSGTGLHRLTRSADFTVSLAFSPDGKRVAFARNDWTIWVMNADGTGRHQVSRAIPQEHIGRTIDEFVSWTPDGRVRYERNAGGGPGQGVWVVNADGSGARLVVPGWVPFEGAWSPDGTRVVWEGDRHTGAGGADIFVADASGANRRRLTYDPGSAVLPAWSPDGRSIVFVNEGAIQVIHADGSGRRTLFSCNGSCVDASWPVWSPDGHQIAFTVSFAGGTTRLYVMRADGTGAHPLPPTPFASSSVAWQALPP